MPGRARIVAGWALLSGLLLLGCARMAPPGGGPEDRTAPRLAGQSPDSGAVGVALDQPITLCFDEAMDRGSVRDWFQVAPWPGRLDCTWERDCYTCRPAEGWRAEETYTVLLGAQARDRRRNPLDGRLLFAFATGDTLAAGLARGEVRTRSLKGGSLPVYLFPWPASGVPGPEAETSLDPLQALRVTQTDAEGRFLFAYVPTGRPLLAGALHDRGGDRAFDPEEDLWGWAEEPLVCSAGGDTATLALYLVYADETGDLAGAVTDSLCAGFVAPARLVATADSLKAILSGALDAAGFAPAAADSAAPGEGTWAAEGLGTQLRLTAQEEDSLRAAVARLELRLVRARADSARCLAPVRVAAYAVEGDSLPAAEVSTLEAFRLEDLAPGLYRLRAYRDLDGDGRAGPAEPAGEFPLPVELRPGRVIEGLEWGLGSPR